jgi:hypothetical protein
MAQDCSTGAQGGQYWDNGYGMWGPKSDPYTYTACVHSPDSFILYEPAFGYDDSGVAQPDQYTYSGVYDYRLVEVAQSPIWQNRLSPNGGIFEGQAIGIGGGQSGLQRFISDPSNSADPMWMWQGGGDADCKKVLAVYGGCWYSFGIDGTSNVQHSANWPTIPLGSLLTAPGVAAASFFGFYDPFDEYTVYNTYLATPPAPPASGPPGSVNRRTRCCICDGRYIHVASCSIRRYAAVYDLSVEPWHSRRTRSLKG